MNFAPLLGNFSEFIPQLIFVTSQISFSCTTFYFEINEISKKLSKKENSVIVFPGNRKVISTSIPLLPANGASRVSLSHRNSFKRFVDDRVGSYRVLWLGHAFRSWLHHLCRFVGVLRDVMRDRLRELGRWEDESFFKTFFVSNWLKLLSGANSSFNFINLWRRETPDKRIAAFYFCDFVWIRTVINWYE